MEPLLKWAGGKRLLLPELLNIIKVSNIDISGHTFFEPFFGGGALSLALEPRTAVFNDINTELINVYTQVQNHPNELISLLKLHSLKHSSDPKNYYYEIRNLDRESEYQQYSALQKAARILYLNRTCYNGLYRVNKKGYFNVPLGNYKNPDIIQAERITNLSQYLNNNNIEICSLDFQICVSKAKKGDIIYFDPPYDYEDQNGFTNYDANGFSRKELLRLKLCSDDLISRGCFVVLSNNNTGYVRELFENDPKYHIIDVTANRMINSNAGNRKNAKEVIIYG